MILDDITGAIGGTPLLRLSRFAPDCSATLLAKLELFNPYSVKDRPVQAMLAAAVERGALAPGGQVVEATSGNTGMALAMISAVRGYRCILVMSEIQSIERRQILSALGAEVVLTPASGGTKAAKAEAMRISASTGAYYLGQHDDPANALAHQQSTAEEIWEDTEGSVDIVVAGLGTTGTLMGISRALKPRKPSLRVIGVEPAISPFISRGVFAPHRIMGTAPGFIPGVLDRGLLDGIEHVTEDEAFGAVRRLARTEGLLVGITSGACALVAQRIAAPGETVVCIAADSGQRYLSVDGLFAEV